MPAYIKRGCDMLSSVLLAVHLLGTVLWVGGMIFALFVLRPNLILIQPAERVAFHMAVLGRFFAILRLVIPAILLSGFIMSFSLYGSFARAPWQVHVMTLTGLIMACVYGAILSGPWRSLQNGAIPPVSAFDRIRQLVHVNFGLGFITIIIACTIRTYIG
ncbi:Hypothetical protein GbCGDNIH1_1311 [Granulibacter bethesdensis CGDNIH1]|uniref:Copper resistance protein D domain-containing protein n=2 Tax=Granulibacter bethesdensis TaxID=364410 RepID=Q0BSJ3_GRABC|nr:Hypothetical protein GbCGDNIH1_1311 [Granulibacter bethesdensis CGDNIH1]APH52036.1 Hypothetical protein GbCGDNIH5_1311 [Granulibacter bethesdensis]APH64726.1 Hypothetical protein GbCGDNIH1I4_1311 [Granulibacter bethesdensis]